MALILSGLLAFVTTLLLAWRFCQPGSCFHLLDQPVARSLHQTPVPRSGGVAVVVGFATGLVLADLLTDHCIPWSILVTAIPVIGVSFLDDCRSLPPQWRLLAHGLGAMLLLLVLFQGTSPLTIADQDGILPLVAKIPLMLFLVVWMINLYNFMDGLDGFAGGMAVIGFSALALLSWRAGHFPLAVAAGLLVVASAGFLWWNWPPARIFLGDTGSTFLGFMVAALGLWGARDQALPLWLTGLVFSPFIVDATVTLGLRLWRREKVWRPHRSHFYQRLVDLGWSHRRIVMSGCGLMLAVGATALWMAEKPLEWQGGMVLGWLMIYGLLIQGVRCLEKRA